MKKVIFIITCALLNTVNSKAQVILFDSTYNYNHEYQFGFDVFQLGDSGYITFAPSLDIQSNNQEALISFYDSFGNRKINKVYGDSGYEYYIGEWGSMQKTFDKGYAFGGDIIKISDYSSVSMLMKLDAKGDTEFVKTFGDTTRDWQLFNRCVQTHDSGYALIGTQVKNWRDSVTYGIYIYVVRTDKDGNLLWQKSYAGTRTDGDGWSILELPNHHLVLSGATEISSVYYPLIIETDSAGNAIKQKMLEGSTFGKGGRMTLSYDNSFVEWGYIDTTINTGDAPTSSLITFLDSNYNVKSRIIYSFTNESSIYEVRQLMDSSFVLVGLLAGADSAYDGGWLAKISREGTKEWEHFYTSSKYYNEFADVEQTKDKGFIITGDAYNPPKTKYNQDLWLIKLDSNGCLQPGCLNALTAVREPVITELNIYPNPNNGDFTVDLPNTNLSKPEIFTVYNLTGQQIFSTRLTEKENEIYLANQLAGGVYICRITTGDNRPLS